MSSHDSEQNDSLMPPPAVRQIDLSQPLPPPLPSLPTEPVTASDLVPSPPIPAEFFPSEASEEKPTNHGCLVMIGLMWLAVAVVILAPALSALARQKWPSWSEPSLISWWLTHTMLPLFLTWLGLATMLGQRWARTFHLAAASAGFAGLLLIGGAWVLITIRQVGPQASYLWMKPAALVLLGLFCCWIILSFFNRPRTLQAIAEADPTPSWTDHWPAAMQLLAVISGLAAWMSLHAALTYPFPYFGHWVESPQSDYSWGGLFVIFTLSTLLTMGQWRTGWWLFLLGLTASVAAWSWTILRPEGAIELSGCHPAWMLSSDFLWLVGALYLACLVFLSSITPLYQLKNSTDHA